MNAANTTRIAAALSDLTAVRAEIVNGFDNAAEQAEYIASETFLLAELANLGVTVESAGYLRATVGGVVVAAWDNGGHPRADVYIPVGTPGCYDGKILSTHGGLTVPDALVSGLTAAAAT
jgi:hypothetical protein